MKSNIIKIQHISNITIRVLFMCHLYISTIFSSPVPQFSFPTNDVNFPNDEFKDVRRCLDEDYSMPAFNRPTGKWDCEKLLTQGSCEEGQWFVLGEDVSFLNTELPTAVCKEKECEPIISSKNRIQEQVIFDGKCTNVTSSKECEEDNMVVLINPFGEGECGCKDRFTDWNPRGLTSVSEKSKCYQEYLQGPCNAGDQLVPKGDVELVVKVNNRIIDTPLWFGNAQSQITTKDNAEDVHGSMCVPSDCKEEGFVHLKTGECIKPELCSKLKTLILSTEFLDKESNPDITLNGEKSAITSCCLSDEEFKSRKIFVSIPDVNGTKYEIDVKEMLNKNACAVLPDPPRFYVGIRSALVTIPESCPRGQTITHDGECKHVRIWRSRPRRSSNSNNRIRQMMRYVRALRRQRKGSE